MKYRYPLLAIAVLGLITLAGCSSWLGKVNIFPVEQDVALGQQVASSFETGSAAVVLDSGKHNNSMATFMAFAILS